jgi:hypothetical protein
MEKGVHITFVVTALAYFLVAICGFYAFGTRVADNVLLTFAHGPTSWVVAMAGAEFLLFLTQKQANTCLDLWRVTVLLRNLLALITLQTLIGLDIVSHCWP